MGASRLWILAVSLAVAGCATSTPQPTPPSSSAAPASVPPTSSAAASGGDLHGQIAYVEGTEDAQIFLLDLATGESRQLTHLEADDAELLGGGPMSPALTCGFGPSALTWSPDGAQLAFTYGGCDSVVFLVSMEGDLRRVGDGRSPAWSPDGSRLLHGANVPYSPCGGPCEGQPPPEPGAWDLRVIDIANDGQSRPFTPDGATSRGGVPSYSPDGTLVAYSGPPQGSDPETYSATYLIGADGSGARLLANGGYPAGWLPDGRLLISRESDGSVHAVDIDSGQSQQVSPAQTTSVSPDGTQSLLWTSDPVTGGPGLRLITAGGELVAELPGSFGTWAPDSSSFAAYGIDSGIHIVSRDGSLVASFEIGAGGGPAAWRPGS